jgi:hypothetical protein
MDKRKIFFFTVMLVIPIVCIEMLLQAFYRISNGGFLFERVNLSINSPDEYRVYKAQPNLNLRQRTNEFDVTYFTNSQGLRTDSQRKDIKKVKPDNTYRILFLGPSFTFGWANNYEDTYVSIISENITAAGKNIEIMNLGTPAQPINYQFCWLEEIGYQYSPDMVIQTVYGEPRIVPTDCHIPTDHPTVHNGYLYNTTDSFRIRILSLVKNSAIVFYGWYIYQFMISTDDNNEGIGTELYESTSDTLSDKDYINQVKSYGDNIAFVRSTVKREIPVIFVHVPVSYVVRPADLSRWAHRKVKDPHMLRIAAKEMEMLLEEESIPFINPLDELIAKDKDTRTYYFLDLHFTPAGNKVLAEKSIPVIQQLINLDVGE